MSPKIRFDKIFCGLDFGSQKIKAGILKISEKNQWELTQTRENTIQGFKDLAVSDLSELTDCIRRTIDDLSLQAGLRFKDVYLGIGAELVESRLTSSVVPLVDKGHKVITARDIQKVNEQAKLLGTKMDEEVLHNIPQNYIVDDINSVLTPLGLYGRKLGVTSLIIVANMSRIRNIVKAVNQAGYDVANIFFSSYVASEMTLTDQDKFQGCVLVDIGSKVTTLQIFKDRTLRYLEKINLAGDDFTRGIASGLSLPFELAEQIKKSYAAAMGVDEFHKEEILVKRENNYITIKRESIYQAIEGPLKNLVNSISGSLQSSPWYNEVNRGITMIGGGSLLPGLIERIEAATRVPVRLGHMPLITHKSADHAAVFSGAAGLGYNGFKRTFGFYISSNGHTKWPKRIMNKLVDLYQDYF